MEMLAKAGGSSAFFCVSGSHPIRTLPGDANPALQLWAAGNPVTESNAERLEQKAEAGASAFLTQPPFAWGNFESWVIDAQKRGICQSCAIIVGIPMLSSSSNLRFWLRLCGADATGQTSEVLQEWATAEAQLSNKDFHNFRMEWNRKFVQKVKSIPGVSGAHLMPFSKTGRKMALDLIEDGSM